MAEKQKEATPARKKGIVKVKLSKDHTHAGKDYKAGDVIDIEEHHLGFLEAVGVIEKKKEE